MGLNQSIQVQSPQQQRMSDDLWKLVFCQLTVDQLPLVALTCKKWKKALTDDVWKKCYSISFGGPLLSWAETQGNRWSRRLSKEDVKFEGIQKSWRRHSRETLAVFNKFLARGKKFCEYAGTAPSLVLSNDMRKLPLCAIVDGAVAVPNLHRAFAWAVLRQHESLVKVMLIATREQAKELLEISVGSLYPLGSDEWFAQTSGIAENQKLVIGWTHIDVDDVMRDDHTPLFSPGDIQHVLNTFKVGDSLTKLQVVRALIDSTSNRRRLW